MNIDISLIALVIVFCLTLVALVAIAPNSKQGKLTQAAIKTLGQIIKGILDK